MAPSAHVCRGGAPRAGVPPALSSGLLPHARVLAPSRAGPSARRCGENQSLRSVTAVDGRAEAEQTEPEPCGVRRILRGHCWKVFRAADQVLEATAGGCFRPLTGCWGPPGRITVICPRRIPLDPQAAQHFCLWWLGQEVTGLRAVRGPESDVARRAWVPGPRLSEPHVKFRLRSRGPGQRPPSPRGEPGTRTPGGIRCANRSSGCCWPS